MDNAKPKLQETEPEPQSETQPEPQLEPQLEPQPEPQSEPQPNAGEELYTYLNEGINGSSSGRNYYSRARKIITGHLHACKRLPIKANTYLPFGRSHASSH